MHFNSIVGIVGACSYKPGWEITTHKEGDRVYIQVSVDVTAEASMDSRSHKRAPWKGGKRYLSYHMCRQEIVGAVFAAIKDAEMHETHEWFRYRGASIYNPHLDPDALANFARISFNFNVRQNAMSMEEVQFMGQNFD